ncbi:MAG: hypothetical protein R2765_03995 [Ferruginibacter sp.]
MTEILDISYFDTLKHFKADVDRLIEKGEKESMGDTKKYIVKVKRYCLEGDGYESDACGKRKLKKRFAKCKNSTNILDVCC